MSKVEHIAIVGPTASGKTALSIELAEKLDLEIVSCDSVSVYKRLNIGSSKPNKDEQARIKHYMIDLVEPWEDYNVSLFEKEAGNILDKACKGGIKKLIVGGTGFYLEALVNGMFPAPASNKKITKDLEKRLKKEGLAVLTEELRKIDPETVNRIAKNDKYRTIRALELYYNTGKTMSYYKDLHAKIPKKRDIKIFVIDEDRKILKEQIHKRTQKMFKDGIVEEVKTLLKETECTENTKSLRTVGYKEILELLQGKLTKEEAIYLINKNTYQLAKRQMTWFRRMKNTEFLSKKKLYNKLSM